MQRHDNPFLIEHRDVRHTINRRTREAWVEDTDPEMDARHQEGRPQYLGRAIPNTRLVVAGVVFTILSLGLLTRTVFLSVIAGDYYGRRAEENRLRPRLVVPERGRIFDRAGRMLADNVPNFALVAVPADLPSDAATRRTLFNRLRGLGFPEADVHVWTERVDAIPRTSSDARRPMVLAERVSYPQAILFETQSEKPFGLYLDLQPIRAYPVSASLLSLGHVLGYLGRIFAEEYATLDRSEYTYADVLGKQGLELTYERVLRGRHGRDRFAVDARGVVQKLVDREVAIPGNDLILTIDSEAQRALEGALVRELAARRLRSGAAIALDPSNGAIRALVSLPAYDNNLFARGVSTSTYAMLRDDPSQPLFPRAVSGEYASGSTVKPVVAAAALAEGVITPQTTILSIGGISVGPWFFPDWKKGGHGPTNVYTAIAESVNTFFYVIAGGYGERAGLGIERLVSYAARFGLGEKLGIDLPGERRGFLPTPEWKERVKKEQWYIGDTYHAAIGQGDVLVTPLQVALWTSVFANNGTLYRPRVVDAVRSIDGLETPVPPEVRRAPVVDLAALRVVRQALRATVTRGSARRLQDLPVTSAGKTGTAEWSSKKKPHAWFTAFAPYEKPELVVTVLVEEGEEGARSALTVAHEFMQWYFSSQNRRK